MKRGTILTTNIKTISTMDVSKENEAYNIDTCRLPENTTVAACSWLSSLSPHSEARLSVLRLIFSLIINKVPRLKLWCFIGDSTWQDDTRIIRYKRLWKGLLSRNIEITHSNNSYEELLEKDKKIRFFGAKSLSELSLESTVKALAAEPCSYLVALPEQADIKTALNLGWEVFDGFDKSLLEYVMANEGLMFKLIGQFDDIESGFVGVGSPDLIKSLI